MFISIRTIICISLVGLCACSDHIEQEQVVGLYVADFGSGTNTLDLRRDHTYVHSYHPTGRRGGNFTNKWEFETWKGRPFISFYGFSADPLAAARSEAVWGG